MKDVRTAPSLPRASGADDHPAVAVILIIAFAAFVVLRACCASIPLERDEGEYAYVAQRMLAGEVPYRDAFDQKPPGVFFAFLVPVALFAPSAVAVHLMLYFWTALTCGALFLVARELAGPMAAAWSVLVFAVISIEPSWLATAANTEQFMLLPMTLSVWCALRGIRAGRRTWWIAAGAAAMAACWFKQVAATNIGFVVALAITSWWRGRRGLREWSLDAAAFVVGLGIVAAPVPAYFAAKGAWEPFVDCVWRHNLDYASGTMWSTGWPLLRDRLAEQCRSLWLIWALACAAILDWRPAARATTLSVAGWLVFSVIGVSIGFYFRHHYFLQAAPALALAAGIMCARITRLIGSHTSRSIRAVWAAVVALGLISPPLITHRKFYFAGSSVDQSRLLYGHSAFGENEAIAEVIRTNTRPDERVLIFGSEPQILFHAVRRSATRYIFFYPLMMELPRAEARQKEAFDEIRLARPACIVWTHIPTSLLMQPGSSRFLEQRVGEMIDADYRLIALRRINGEGVQVLSDASAVAAALEARRADPEGTVLDMLVFVRKLPSTGINPHP